MKKPFLMLLVVVLFITGLCILSYDSTNRDDNVFNSEKTFSAGTKIEQKSSLITNHRLTEEDGRTL